MVTSGAIYHFLRFLTFPVDIRNICVLLAPACSGLTAFAAYLFTSEMVDSPSAGLLAAVFMGIAPGYISRSVAGSYDNEAIAIFLLVFTFYLWIKSVKEGSIMWGALCALFYGYMVASWGGYVFITNMLPLHAFVLICMGRFSPRLYVSYTTWYALGTIASMQIPFVGFLPIRSSDHMAALGALTVSVPCNFSITNKTRCIWPDTARWIYRVRQIAVAKQAVPDSSPRARPCRLFRISWRLGPAHRLRHDRSMVRTFLLPLGHWLRQGPHSNHRIRF